MGKQTDLAMLALSVFGTNEWQNEGIVTHPSNFTGNVNGNEYIRVSLILGEPRLEYTNLNSMAGQIVIDIFTPAGVGPLRAAQIADVLDSYLVGKIFSSLLGSLQIGPSVCSGGKLDTANKTLYRTIYTLSVSYFGK